MIKFLVMDVDGTLTDGKVYIGNDGEVFKAYDIKDGYGIKFLLRENDIEPVIITARKSMSLINRCAELDIKHLFQSSKNKVETLLSFIEKYNQDNGTSYSLNNVAYIGDDLADLDCMKLISSKGGIIGCPQDSALEVKNIADYISINKGGRSAVRDFIEYLISCHKYTNVSKRIENAINYLKSLPENINTGIYNVDSSFYFKVIEYDTLEEEKCVFESHKKYVDIQLIINGEERIDVCNDSSLIPSSNYDSNNDIILYEPTSKYHSVYMVKNSIVVLYPNDAHRGCVKVNDKNTHIRKIVGKVLIN